MQRRAFLKLTTVGSVPLIIPGSLLNNFNLKLPEDELESQFINPPYTARPQGFWFWMNGNITKDGITRDIKAMEEVGLGGVLNMNVTDGIPAGSVIYDSREWHAMMKHSLQTLKQHNMLMVSYNCAGWSSGGGPWISPDQSMKKVVWSEQQVQGPNSKFQDKLAKPESEYNYYRDIVVLAFPTPPKEVHSSAKQGFRLKDWQAKTGNERKATIRPKSDTRNAQPDEVINSEQIIDVSSKMGDDGMLAWEVPEGNWTIIRFGYTTTGAEPRPAPKGGQGLECDKLSREATKYHWDQMVNRIMKDAGDLTGDTLCSIEIDSFEQGPQNWTQKFAEEFEKHHGYKILNYLPCITGRVVDSVDKSERILWDFRRTIADMFAKNYYGTFADLCHKNGMKLSIEPYGYTGFFDAFSVAAQADIPMGEIWVNRYNAYHWSSSKLASSAAHANGHQIVGAESFTAAFPSSGWNNDPYSLKNLGDHLLTSGVNRLIIHNTVHHPWKDFTPGMTMGPHGIQMNRGNTWYKQSSAWLSYLSRSSFLLQQGQFIGDICYYLGENVPNSLRDRKDIAFENSDEVNPKPPKGYDYDVLATEFIMQFEVKNGRLTLPGGMQYQVLVIPDFIRTIRPVILQKIHDLIQAGATVVAPKPDKSPSLANFPQCDMQVQTLADKIWGNIDGQNVTRNRFGKGQIYWGEPLDQILDHLNVPPDFSYTHKNNVDIQYIHRRINGDDVYFVSNQTQRYANIECTFRSMGIPERWIPETATIENIILYRQENGRTAIPLLMDPAESYFIIFRNKEKRDNWVVDARVNNQNILETHTLEQDGFELIEARYGILDDPSKTMDVMQEVSSQIHDGQLDIMLFNHVKHDPAPQEVKKLFIKYRLNGKLKTKTINKPYAARIVVPAQPGGLTLPSATLQAHKSGKIFLEAWKTGIYHLQMANDKTKTVKMDSVSEPKEIKGPWTVKFPPNWGVPPEVTFDHLISWTEHSHFDIKHFSGTATYEKELNIPEESLSKEQALYLDLGKVKNIAEVILNGKNLGILWKPPFRVNISDAVKAGSNQLQIKITNLLSNRLIGDSGKPDIRPFRKSGNRGFAPTDWDIWMKVVKEEEQNGRYSKETGRYTFSTWKRFDKDDQLLDSGLIGPVRILTAVRKEITI